MSSSSNQSKTITSNPNIQNDESKWVIHIQKTLERELEEENEINVSIFGVPKTLMVYDPECYVPQRVAIGPYHYTNPELHEMERHKLDAAKIFQKQLRTIKLHSLAEEMMKVESRIRLSYDKQLNLRVETLAWMMAVDASFLLEFLKVYAVKEGKLMAAMISAKMSHLVDLKGKKSSHNALLRDIIMLENQIPFFILRKMLQPQCPSPEASDDLLLTMLMGLSKELSPFKNEGSAVVQIADATHLLGYLFQTIVPEMESEHVEIEIDENGGMKEKKDGEEDEFLKNSGYVKSAFGQVWGILKKLNKGPARALKRLSSLAPVKTVLLMPWKAITKLPGLNVMKGPIESLFSCGQKPDGDENSDSKDNADKPPSIEEITIPSVTELANAGVRFIPTKKGILSIEFDAKTFTLYLPVVTLDINSEVVLRNLVAYEACIAKGPLVLARYTEFMNGIVDTDEDVKFLREKGIILNRLKSDSEVANLWNGMNKSVRLTKVAFLDKTIDDVNKFYNCRWNVKTKRFMRSYIFGSWQFLTLLATIVLLLLMVLQSFCSVYTCSRFFNDVTILGTNEQN
ncbi:PREDICTED: putative UPF0481 protein At3g02645 [Ipomoea nil]|uniref:putative UPF0481 protein At3g02645 n=1 Tax=Ipomoea nil TaxID=35883 RepID=UPI0009010FCE|nr:PREDICTED: putative UPF0481 protein At3g02645 [Ipomoea nil]